MILIICNSGKENEMVNSANVKIILIYSFSMPVFKSIDYINRKLVIKGLSWYKCKKSKHQNQRAERSFHNSSVLILESVIVELLFKCSHPFPFCAEQCRCCVGASPLDSKDYVKRECTTDLYWLNCSRNKICM